MKDTKEIQVFISCPGDVTLEKDMIIKACDSKNDSLITRGSKFRLKPLDFRTINGAMFERPQQQINNLFISYDIYIGLLWMRFGTPSGANYPDTGKPYESGTEEEFDLARRKFEKGEDLKIYLFFKHPRETKSLEENNQLLKVQTFRKQAQLLGWVHNFDDLDSDKINNLLEEYISNAQNMENLTEKQAYLETPPVISGNPIKEVTKFITKAEQFEGAVIRTLSEFDVRHSMFEQFGQPEGNSLIELVKTVKRLVVLGNAGSGKSTELGNLAHFYAKEETPFVPVYQRLNTYVDEDLEYFLPQGWNAVPQNICMIILDGLDEVQPVNFNTLVRKILTFSDKFPDLRMVVSCRTNLYSFPDDTSGGTLSNFEVFFLDDIKTQNLGKYIETKYQANPTGFLKEVQKQGMDDLIHQPFFLNMLLSEFRNRGNLDLKKADLLNNFISSRIAHDQAHYQLAVPLKEKEPYIIKLLQKVALCMEYLGRNFISFKELTKLLPDPKDISLIKFSTAFMNFENETDKWGFEHNNIQEYLAASALLNLNQLEIRTYLSIGDKKIKPSWLNTLFFLMGILDDQRREALIKWILEIDPEVLVKIEPDKVNTATRLAIFKSIFEHYKKQGVWLRSNKFSTAELARFAPHEAGSQLMLNELNDDKNTRIVRLNALMILRSLKLKTKELKIAKDSLLKYAESQPEDVHIFYNVTDALTELGFGDKQTIERLFNLFGERKNQYIRSGFYRMIISAGLVDNYLSYFIEGLFFQKSGPDREEVHLLDEDMLIKEAFSGSLNYESVVELLRLFEAPRAGRLNMYDDKKEILKSLISKATLLYQDHPELYEIISMVYNKGSRPSDEGISEIIAEFFHNTETDQQVFKSIFYNKELSDYEKGMLYKYVLSKPAIDFVISQYTGRDLTNKDVLEFYNSINRFSGRIRKPNELQYLKEELNTHTSILKDQIEVDHEKIRLDQTRKNTSYYFCPEEFKNTIKDFFKAIDTNELDWDTLWRHNSFDPKDGISLPEPIFDLLVDYTRDMNKVTLDQVLNRISDQSKFQDYLFKSLKERISANSDVVLTHDQQSSLEAWVKEKIKTSDVTNAIRINQKDPNHITYNRIVMVLWYFISNFKIKVDLQKLLDFTLYAAPIHNQDISLDFGILEELAGKEKVMARVQANLENGIAYYESWKNNSAYALENNIQKTYPIILKEIGNTARAEYGKEYVLKKYIERTSDFAGVANLFKKLDKDELRWSVMELLSTVPQQQKLMEPLLVEVLESPSENENEKFKAAKYLTKDGEPTGTTFYLRVLKQKVDTAYDFYRESVYLGSIRDSKFIPELIELLTIANKPEMKKDNFNRLDNYLANALYSIGLVSEENLTHVKDALEKFITDNTGVIEHVNFYYPMLEKMEYHFWLAQSKQATIEQAIVEVKKLDYFNQH